MNAPIEPTCIDALEAAKRRASDKIGDMCRYIGYGVIAIAFALATSDKAPIMGLYAHNRALVLWMAGLGVLTIIFEYLNMLLIFLGTESEIRRLQNAPYQAPAVFVSALTMVFALLKQVGALAAALLLLFVVLRLV